MTSRRFGNDVKINLNATPLAEVIDIRSRYEERVERALEDVVYIDEYLARIGHVPLEPVVTEDIGV